MNEPFSDFDGEVNMANLEKKNLQGHSDQVK